MGEEKGAVTFIHLRIQNASDNSSAHATLWSPLEIHCDFFFLNHSGLSLSILREAEVTAQARVKLKKKSAFANKPLKGLYLNSR